MIQAARMAFRSLVARPTRTLLTMFGIVLGVAVILAVSITNESTLNSLTAVFGEVSGNSDLMVMSGTEDAEGFSQDARRWVVSVPGVRVAAPSVHALALLAGDSLPTKREASFFGGVETRMTVYGIDPMLDPAVRLYKVVEGEFLPDDLGVYEMVLVSDFAAENHIDVGDDVSLITPNGIEMVRVIGLISKEGAGQLNNGMFGVMPLRAVQELFNRAGDIDQIDIVAGPEFDSSEGLETLRVNVEQKLGAEYVVTFPATQGERVTQMLDVFQMGLSMFSVIALFVGAFLIYNAFSMTVVERTREIGMQRTIGMTRGQVMRQIMFEAAILGVVGSGLGVGGGILLAKGLIGVMETLMAQDVPAVSVPPQGLATGVAVGLITTLLAAAIPSFQAGRVSPLEALRARAKPDEGWLVRRGWIVGLLFLGISVPTFLFLQLPGDLQFFASNGSMFLMFTGATLLTPVTIGPWERVARPFVRVLFGGEGRLGGSNIQRSKMRTTMTVTALMVGIAMLLSIQALTAAFTKDLKEWIDGYMGGDLYVYSSMPMRKDFGERLEMVGGVEAVSPTRYLNVEVEDPSGGKERLAYHVIDPAAHERVGSFMFTSNQGDPAAAVARLAAGDAVFISTVIADRYGLQQGDALVVQTRRGPSAFEVAGVVVDFYDRGMVITGSWRDMRQYFRVDDVAAFQVKVSPGFTADEVRGDIDAIYGTRRNLTAESNAGMKDQALQLSAQSFALFDVLAWIAVVVASLGVVNTLMMNVMERTREIGMLRGVGMTRWQVVKMILSEAGLMGGIGGLLGMGVGMFLSQIFLMGANTTQGYDLEYVLPVQGLALGFVIALVVSQLAAVWPSGRAARLEIIEAIQFE